VAARLEFGHLGVLVLGKHLREQFVDPKVSSDRVGDLTRVAGDHSDVDAVSVQGVDGLPRLLAWRVLKGDGPDHLIAFDHVEHGGASLDPAAPPAHLAGQPRFVPGEPDQFEQGAHGMNRCPAPVQQLAG
jgi:hypothetical protein